MNSPGKNQSKGMAKLTKHDIGFPKNFMHKLHIGWDVSKGFEVFGMDDDDDQEPMDPADTTIVKKIGLLVQKAAMETIPKSISDAQAEVIDLEKQKLQLECQKLKLEIQYLGIKRDKAQMELASANGSRSSPNLSPKIIAQDDHDDILQKLMTSFASDS